jgi:hypothetical protein
LLKSSVEFTDLNAAKNSSASGQNQYGGMITLITQITQRITEVENPEPLESAAHLTDK